MTKPRYKYTVTVCWSERVAVYIAEALELPGEHCGPGVRTKEAIGNLEVVMDEWIETAIELGSIPEPEARPRL